MFQDFRGSTQFQFNTYRNDVCIGLSLLTSVFVELYFRQADVSFNNQAAALPTAVAQWAVFNIVFNIVEQ